MKCPICVVDLVMTDRQGVEIDYCPKCRGVWLDRGELDKIIEKNISENINKKESGPQPSFSRGSGFDDHDDHHDRDGGYFGGHGGRRKKGMLGEIFDF
ncbi:MAG: zf-TFIIB domain-containing protein [bacterium]